MNRKKMSSYLINKRKLFNNLIEIGIKINKMSSTNNNENINRYVFHGTNEMPMFKMESDLNLPILNDGEVLVKVRAATICLSDIHTVCGTRIEPTPRYIHIYIFNLIDYN